VSFDPAALPNDVDALKSIIGDMVRDAVAARTEIEKLRFQLARFKRTQFGQSSEKVERTVEQLELAIETLEEDDAQRLATVPVIVEAIESALEQSNKPARRALPEHLPREEIVHPGACTCPQCGGALRKIGADVTETLDYVPGRFKVVRHIREAFSCRVCETVVQAPAPHHPIARGRAGAGLLAHIIVSKFDDHLPLYRQAEIYAREGVTLETSTLSGWVGATTAAVAPLLDALRRDVMASKVLHGDDTPVPVLAPGAGKTRTGRLWVYVRDERSYGGERSPAAAFFYSPDRAGERPRAHLKDFTGVLHADGYAGFKGLYRSNRIVEAACWAHVRRKFFDVHAANGSEIAKEAIDRIGALYGVETAISGARSEERRLQRQMQSRPIADAIKGWAEGVLPKLSARSELAKAFRYMLSRWPALTRCFADGRLSLDNNPAERALRGVALGRKNYLFAGSDRGGERAAAMYSLIETAKLNGLDSEAYLRDIIGRIADHPINRVAELLPWNWRPSAPAAQAA
jgi:transposase